MLRSLDLYQDFGKGIFLLRLRFLFDLIFCPTFFVTFFSTSFFAQLLKPLLICSSFVLLSTFHHTLQHFILYDVVVVSSKSQQTTHAPKKGTICYLRDATHA